MKNLASALVKAQSLMRVVAKNANNPHFKSKYATLDDILGMARPILAENGLCLVQTPIVDGNSCGVQSTLIHESGETLDCGQTLLPIGRGGGAQGVGSSITYARRYSFSSIFLIACGDDDDGNEAQKSYQQQEDQKKKAEEDLKRNIEGVLSKLAENEIQASAEFLGKIENGTITMEYIRQYWKEIQEKYGL